MTRFPTDHLLGRIEPVRLNDMPVLSRDVAFDMDMIHQAWPVFEHSFDSLRGRKMMGLIFNDEDVYRMCSVRLDRDTDDPLNLDETVVPSRRGSEPCRGCRQRPAGGVLRRLHLCAPRAS